MPIELSALKACARALRQAMDPSGVVPDAEMLADFIQRLEREGFQLLPIAGGSLGPYEPPEPPFAHPSPAAPAATGPATIEDPIPF